MLARCLIQQLRISSSQLRSLQLRSSSKSILFARDGIQNQLIKDRKLTINHVLLNKDKRSNLENYELFKEKLRTQTSAEVQNLAEFEHELSQLGLIHKFKKIVSEYWHVIICVHAVTSAIWFGLMCLIKYEFDLTPEPLIKYARNYNVPEFILAPLKYEMFQMIAVPFFLYKCITPIRYYSTIYTTMRLIRYLMPKGIINARPTPKIIQLLYGKYKKPKKNN